MIALTSKAVFHLASQSSTGEVSTNRVSGFVAVHPCCNAAELCEVKKLIGVIALTSKAVFHLASQSSTGEVSTTGSQALLLCIPAVMQQSTV